MNYNKGIKIIRSVTGLSQSGFAEIIKIDPSLISRYEAGERPVTETLMKKVVKELGIPQKLFELVSASSNELKSVSELEAARIGRELIKLTQYAEKNTKS